MRTRIKICGIKDAVAASAAVHAGADAIGLMFYRQSKRCVDIKQAQAIVRGLPPMVAKVAVLVNPDANEVIELVEQVPLDILQFHGDEDDAFCSRFCLPYIKAIRVTSKTDFAEIELQYPQASALLFDTYVDGTYGGTGETFDWSLARDVCSKPIILAGGLNCDNVQQAINIALPYAVDVSSGVETDGAKDAEKMIAFCHQVQQLTNNEI